MKSPDQFLPAQGPPALSSGLWSTNYDTVRVYGAKFGSPRTPWQTEVGIFWTDFTPAQANQAYRKLALDQNLDTVDSARFFAMVEAAGADSCIGCWNAKYHSNFWRPVTAIRAGDPDGNAATAADASWEPLAVTPGHPEFPSAHGCYTSATSHVLAAFFGTDHIQSTYLSTTTGTTQTFARFSDVMREVAAARVYGGMHYPYSVQVGELLGQKVAQQIAAQLFRPVPNGKDSESESEW